jgi:endonuclease/exonuclease/phosphatase family metal-dependent hydrolase
MATLLTCITYNVRCCTMGDAGGAVRRVAEVLGRWHPDVVALQEIDLGRRRTGGIDQARELAAALDMTSHFQPAVTGTDGDYGIALLCRGPLRVVRSELLPLLPDRPGYAPRGAIWAAVKVAGHEVQVIATHLGLTSRERHVQLDALLGPDWLGDPRCRSPRILLGDLNFLTLSREYRRLTPLLRDALRTSGSGWRGTFPAALPLVRLDYVFASPDLRVTRARVAGGPSRRASDHLPVVAALELPPAESPATSGSRA